MKVHKYIFSIRGLAHLLTWISGWRGVWQWCSCTRGGRRLRISKGWSIRIKFWIIELLQAYLVPGWVSPSLWIEPLDFLKKLLSSRPKGPLLYKRRWLWRWRNWPLGWYPSSERRSCKILHNRRSWNTIKPSVSARVFLGWYGMQNVWGKTTVWGIETSRRTIAWTCPMWMDIRRRFGILRGGTVGASYWWKRLGR